MASLLRGLLDDGELFELLDHDHPGFNHYLVFDDDVSHEHDADLDAMVVDLARLDGVLRVVREDREVVLISSRLDETAIGEWLVEWWAARA